MHKFHLDWFLFLNVLGNFPLLYHMSKTLLLVSLVTNWPEQATDVSSCAACCCLEPQSRYACSVLRGKEHRTTWVNVLSVLGSWIVGWLLQRCILESHLQPCLCVQQWDSAVCQGTVPAAACRWHREFEQELPETEKEQLLTLPPQTQICPPPPTFHSSKSLHHNLVCDISCALGIVYRNASVALSYGWVALSSAVLQTMGMASKN